MRKIILIMIFGLFSILNGIAQNGHRITIIASTSGCSVAESPSFDMIFDSNTIYTVGQQGVVYDNTDYGKNPGSGYFSILVEGSFCIGSHSMTYDFTGSTCKTISFNGNIGGGATITGSIKYQAPSLSKPTILGIVPGSEILCETRTLNTTGNATSYKWMVASGLSSYQVFATTSTTSKIISPSTFDGYGFIPGNKLYFKVRDAQCPQRISLTSGGYAFDSPPPDKAIITKTNVSCKGTNNGVINISSLQYTIGKLIPKNYDGSELLSYTIRSNSDPNFVIANIMATNQLAVSVQNVPLGAWDIYVGRDDSDCSEKLLGNVVITEPNSALSIGTPSKTNERCRSSNNGTITINPSGGWGGYTYSKNSTTNYQASNQFIGLAAGTYTMRVKDSGGCVKSTSVTITQPSAELSIGTPSKTNETCRSSNNGTITINAVGGWNGKTYSKNSTTNYQSSNQFTGLAAGTYTMRVKDSVGCVKSTSVTITQPSTEMSISSSKSNESCRSANDGRITVSASGGWGSYQYSKNSTSNYQTSNVFTGLTAGTYTIRAKDSGGCVKPISVTINQPTTELSIGTPTVKQTCMGTNEGQITIYASGGWGGKTYSINSTTSYQTSNIFSSLAAGTYTVRVKDAGGCVKSTSATISEPSQVLAMSVIKTDVLCKGTSTGTVTVSASGGWSTQYVYSINSTISYQSSNVFPNVFAGTHIIRVKDAEDCLVSESVTINEPSNTLSFTVTSSNITCQGDGNGQIEVTASGGWGSLQYSIDNGSNYQTSNLFTNLSPGTYYVRAKDGGSCEALAQTITLEEPNDFLDLSVAKTEVICKGAGDGSIILSGVGGWSGYEYSIDNGNNFQASGGFMNLIPGDYNAVVMDLEGCQTIAQLVTVTEPSTPLSFTYQQFNISCKDASDGVIVITSDGGWGSYEYSNDGGISYQIGSSFTSLSPGSYNILVKDGNNCETSSQSVVVIEPDLLQVMASSLPVTCYGSSDGSIMASATGGTLSYQYSIDGGANYQSNNNFTGLSAAGYVITVKDGNDCETTVSSTVATPTPLSGTILLTNPISCYGNSDGALSIASASGGTGALSYLWSTGDITTEVTGLIAGVYSVVVEDENNCTTTFNHALEEPNILEISGEEITNISCNGEIDGMINITVQGGTIPYAYLWSNGALTEDISGLSANDYTVNITDAKGCTTSQMYTIIEPQILLLSVNQIDNISCFGGSDGSVTLSASGGTSPYQYSIDQLNWQLSNVISGLTSASHTFYIQDNNGCVSNVTDMITEPELLEVSTQNIIHTTCGNPNGSAESIVVGGTPPYSYSWKDGLNNEVVSSAHINNVSSDIYTVDVTDDNGCTSSAIAIITNLDGADFTVAGITATLCSNSIDGQATVTINGGIGPFNVLWSNGETTLTATSLSAGINTVAVTDANNCDVIQSINIPSPTPINFTTVFEQSPSCNGGTDAVVEIAGTGGTAPYSYSWENGQTGSTLSNVAANDYQVIITDNNSCETSFTYTVLDTPLLELQIIENTPPKCVEGSDGVLEISGQGGTSPYIYDWGSLGALPRIENLSAGDYPVTVEDVNGCIQNAVVTLLDPELLGFVVTNESTPSCAGETNGFIEIAGTNGLAPYSYQWSSGITGNRLQNISGGTYEVIITDANSCNNTLLVPFSEPDVLTVNSINQVDPTCYGFGNGRIDVEVVGGTAPYFYNWNTGAIGKSLDNLSIGNYIVYVSDANGCETSLSITLNQPTPLALTITDFVLPTCHDDNDGILGVEITGGTTPYTTVWNTGSSELLITSLEQNDYTISIEDFQGCMLVETIPLSGVEPIVSEVVVNDPLCHGFDDGAISLSSTGGTGLLSYIWDDGSTTSERTGLLAGNYNVTVSDEQGCVEDLVISLVNPNQIEVILPNAEICEGGSYRALLNLGEGFQYEWSMTNGFNAVGNEVVLDQVGVYTVLATDVNGCVGEGTFELSTNTNLLQADFLMASEGYVGDTIVVIDISMPVPDRVDWSFQEGTTILSQQVDYAEVIYSDPGEYEVILDAGLAECIDINSQWITILPAWEKPKGESGRMDNDELSITKFIMYPNPTDGQFNVVVELTKEAVINIKLINTSGNELIINDSYRGDNSYELGYALPNRLQSGLYFLVVEAGKESKTIRVLTK